MSKISKAFEGHKALIAFITGGDPNLETTEKLVPAMAKAGADLIEIGIPFSDPIAEGPVIQEADERSLKAGCTTDKLFDAVSRIREKTDVPLLFMTYLNPVFTYGKEKFMRRCAECGIDGVIVPDLPYEEKDELAEVCSSYGIELISLIAPTSKERISMIARESEGFVYCVSSLGVTGVRSEIKTDIGAMVTQVRSATRIPCAVGFGISTPEQAAEMAGIADGAIVGSAIVKIIAKHGRDCVGPVTEFVQSLRKAIDNKFDKEINKENCNV
jgi:tryptophan synthase alpha chain